MSSANKNRVEYQNRVNRVIDHIQAHRAEALSLESLAQVAAFSPFHFHRIFKAITGENLNEFVQRVRLEWAAGALKVRQDADVLEIALDCGFQSASAFARAFKERFGMTATRWRNGGAAEWSKSRQAVSNSSQVKSKPGKEPDQRGNHDALCGGDGSPPETEDIMNVTVKTLPSYRIAYLRYVGPYGAAGGISQLWQRLQRWAAAHDRWTTDRICLGLSYDNPRVTDPDKCRYDAGIVVPDDLRTDAQVNTTVFPGGKYGAADFQGTALEIGPAWERLFSGWLPQSGFQPDDRTCTEVYRGDAVDMKTGVFRCELCVPIKPL
jgi:AraC family transcriptional regulator